jgi:hypothetical protein
MVTTRVAPTPTPAVSARTPFPGDARFLPKITVTNFRKIAQKNGFECRADSTSALAPVRSQLSCSHYNGFITGIDINYQDDTHVAEIRAQCRPKVTNPHGCDNFFVSVAGLVFKPGLPTRAAEASQWTVAHGHSDAHTTIGPVDIQASLDGYVSFAAVG